MKVLKVADLCQTSSFEVDFLTTDLKKMGFNLVWEAFEEKDFAISSENLRKYDISFLCGQSCLDITSVVHHRALNVHYINYLDVIENLNGKLWGDSVFSIIFQQIFLDLRKNRQLSGSVIFLGSAEYHSPIVAILAKFGFRDFNFLCTQEQFQQVNQVGQNLMGVQLDLLDSAELIRSSKEYSLCFVTDKDYSESVLSDISYFHFLSQRSLVLNLAGPSNFPFQEVNALGTEVIPPDSFKDARLAEVHKKIVNYAKNLSV